MKKLIKKFVILAVISALLGYRATKDIQQKTNGEYIEPASTVNAEETVESETVDLFFQGVDKEADAETVTQNTEQNKFDVEGTEEVSAGLAIVEPISTPTPERKAEVKEEAQVTVQTIMNNPIPSNTPESTPAATPTPRPTVIPTPTLTPEPTSTPVPQFDINYWTGFAQNYAQSIGLVLESSAVDCWDNPIPAGHHCKNIEQNITDRLNRYKNLEGFTDVWIWSVETGADTYDIYIGYA